MTSPNHPPVLPVEGLVWKSETDGDWYLNSVGWLAQVSVEGKRVFACVQQCAWNKEAVRLYVAGGVNTDDAQEMAINNAAAWERWGKEAGE